MQRNLTFDLSGGSYTLCITKSTFCRNVNFNAYIYQHCLTKWTIRNNVECNESNFTATVLSLITNINDPDSPILHFDIAFKCQKLKYTHRHIVFLVGYSSYQTVDTIANIDVEITLLDAGCNSVLLKA